MSQVINTNIMSLTAQRNLGNSQSSLNTALTRLSSGLRINSAKDDAAGLAIAQRFSSQTKGMSQAVRNANDGISMAQTAEGALTTSSTMLQRIRTLAVQSANATNSSSDREALNQEVNQLASELDRIASTTNFNGQSLLDGTNSSVYQVGANAGETITSTTSNFRTTAYGNYRIGYKAATASDSTGDLTVGSSAGSLASSAATTNRVAGGTLAVSGAAGAQTITYSAAASAKSVAALVNAKTGGTGVTADALTDIELTGASAGGSYVMSIASNNSTAVSVSFTTTGNTADGLSSAINAINQVSSKTGVTAAMNADGDAIELTNSTGENITIGATSGTGLTLGAQAIASGATAVATGSLTFDSDKSFSVTGSNSTDFMLATTATSSGLQKVSEMDVSTVAGANRTLAIVDSALASVAGQRAKFGALQSRFENTISNLQVGSENMEAARSRIEDADYAEETSSMTKGQILQQAGTAMLAQANKLPQSVLTLLQ